jgi:hypothetical protein
MISKLIAIVILSLMILNLLPLTSFHVIGTSAIGTGGFISFAKSNNPTSKILNKPNPIKKVSQFSPWK